MKTKKIFIAVAAFLLFSTTTRAALFIDVPETNRYIDSIEYLVASGILSGYSDHTFHPDQSVNRAEFLKIALGSSDIATDEFTPTGFSDVDESAWYSPYLRKAKKEGWIEGYPDGTFKPEQFVNKVEALKIIGAIQDWKLKEVTSLPYGDTPRTAWYTPFVAYAKEKNFLEEAGKNFIPDTYYSRAKISELLFRTYITAKSGEDEYSATLIKKFPATQPSGAPEPPEVSPVETNGEPVMPAEQEQNFTSVNFKNYDNNFFDGITLTSEFPNIYYLHEVYNFEGTTKTNEEEAFIFIAPKDAKSPSDYTTYVAKVENGTVKIPVIFRKAGNYRLGLIMGDSGESKVIDISILPQLPKPASAAGNTQTPLKPQISYQNEQTSVTWNDNGYGFIRLILFQGKNTEVYYFRQGKEKFDVDYTDFSEFSEGTVQTYIEGTKLSSTYPLQITSGWSTPTKKSFTATTHQYNYRNKELHLSSLSETFPSLQTIRVEGKDDSDIYLEGAVIKPDGMVDLLDLTTNGATKDYYGSKVIPAGTSFTFTYEPKTNGTYNVEINGVDGSAVLNAPVYINTGIPFLPDFFDLNRYAQPEGGNFNMTDARKSMLALINEERIKVGLTPVVPDDALNNLAQLHSKDMVTRDFFSHVNPDGETPNDRRKELDIATSVSENLAIAPTIMYTHKGLMQSAIHRHNILDPKWTKVGIGIVKNDEGSLVTTQEFSGNPLNETDFSRISNDILTSMNAKRKTNGISALALNTTLNTAAKKWSTIMAEQKFFDFSAPNGDSLAAIVQSHVPDKAVQALILESSSSEKLTSESLLSTEVNESQWKKIGIGLATDDVGTIKTTILFTTD